MTQAAQHQYTGNHLGNYSGNGYACYIQMKADHKDQVQYCIGKAGNDQENQGPLGIPYCTKDSSSVIVQHEKGHSKEIDPHIQHGLPDHIIRCTH